MMRAGRFALALALFVLAGSAVPAVAQSAGSTPSAYDLRQGWFSRDKAYHLSLSAAGAAGSYAVARHFGLERWQAAVVSVVATGTMGLLRETWDTGQPGVQFTRRFFSRRDMMWNGIGIAVGIPIGELLSR